VPIPTSLETLHFLIGGRTGTGKTVAIKEMLSSIIPRGDRVIITDPNGDFLSRFWKKGDVILNPFDRRGVGWSIFNELNSTYDHERFAKSVIPPSRSTHDAEWHGYAQLLFAETTKRLFQEKRYSTQELSQWLTLKPVEELAAFLSGTGTAAAGLFDPGAAKALASTRFIIASYLAAHQYLKEGSFSLKKWLKNEKGGNLFITWRENMAEALRPLISTWLDILCTSILSLPPSEKRRIWIIIDELASLERLNSLEAALTKGRKHGLRIVTGLQSTAQLENLYGREKSIVLRSCFSNLLILGGTSSDSQTAEDFSRGLGEQDLERIQTSTTQTRQGSQRTKINQRIRERIVLPSEITNLPSLNGYLSLAGDCPVAQVKLKPIKLNPTTHRFKE
jgi:type IV secretory pathway TraG/TraD family ATPase VirD4